MTDAEGTTRNLSDSRVQALQAIVNSVSPHDGGTGISQDDTMSDGQIRQISAKLGEIFGDDPNIVDGTTRNKKGEMLNEDGLPIIDINEPEFSSATIASAPTANFDDPDILPQWTLSPEEIARRKAERERILDLLELEERQEEERQELSERQRFLEDLERRKQAAKSEMDDLKSAKELQRKMGRALVRNIVETREKKAGKSTSDSTQESLSSKKSVTFADGVGRGTKDGDTAEAGDWGDVIPAKLNKGKPPLWASKQPMKMEVVESLRTSAPVPPPRSAAPELDSDDESNPDITMASDTELVNAEDPMSRNVAGGSVFDELDSNGFMDDEEPVSDWGDEQFDTARHQREVALAYYEKRKTIGSQVTSAMRAHTHEGGENEWDRPTVPVEATLSSAPPKPLVSKFKASLVTSNTSTLASHSLDPFVISSSQSSVLGRAVRYGKLEDGQLVGGDDGQSDDDLQGPGPTEEEIMKLLEQGDVTNIGSSSPNTNNNTYQSRPSALSALVPGRDSNKSRTVATWDPSSVGSPMSDQSTLHSPASSALSTPLAVTKRSSSQLTTSIFPSPVPTPLMAHQLAMSSRVTERVKQSLNRGMPRKTTRQRAFTTRDSRLNMMSNEIESPSFSSDRDVSNPSFQSMIIESPSFTGEPARTPLHDNPTRLGAEVKEAGSVGRSAKSIKKVSRFISERG